MVYEAVKAASALAEKQLSTLRLALDRRTARDSSKEDILIRIRALELLCDDLVKDPLFLKHLQRDLRIIKEWIDDQEN